MNKKSIVYLFKGHKLVAKYLMIDNPSNRIKLLKKFKVPMFENQSFLKYYTDSVNYQNTTVQILKA